MKRNVIIVISAAVAAILMIAVIYIMLEVSRDDVDTPIMDETTIGDVTSSEETTLPPVQTEPVTIMDFVSKKDFAAMKELYPHAYAWIEIPGTNIDYPIIQHPVDDNYYLRRDEMGNYSVNGCIFSEHLYNTTDFTDPVTLIYGHYVYEADGYKYFGGLQTMYRNDLEQYKEIVIYHPDKELHYEVFAAVPYNQYHILWGEDYTKAESFNSFIDGIKNVKAFDATINKDCEVTPEDKIIVLSTCYNGRDTSRFLVVAKLVETIE